MCEVCKELEKELAPPIVSELLGGLREHGYYYPDTDMEILYCPKCGKKISYRRQKENK